MNKDTTNTEKPQSAFIFGTNEICEIFGISRDTLSVWAKKGAPKEGRGSWDIRKLIKWRYGEKSDSPEARKNAADASFREIKARKEQIALDLLEKKLIERGEVDKQWTSVGIQIKNNLLVWSKSLTPHLAHQDMRNVEAILSEAVYDLLSQLSTSGKFKEKKTGD